MNVFRCVCACGVSIGTVRVGRTGWMTASLCRAEWSVAIPVKRFEVEINYLCQRVFGRVPTDRRTVRWNWKPRLIRIEVCLLQVCVPFSGEVKLIGTRLFGNLAATTNRLQLVTQPPVSDSSIFDRVRLDSHF